MRVLMRILHLRSPVVEGVNRIYNNNNNLFEDILLSFLYYIRTIIPPKGFIIISTIVFARYDIIIIAYA